MKFQVGGKTTARALGVLGLLFALCLGVLGSTQLASAGLPAGPSVAPNSLTKIEHKALEDTANGKSTQFIIVMAQKADLSKAYAMRNEDERGWFVYNTLKAHADKSQANLRAELTRMGVPYQFYWVSNILVVTGNRVLVDTLAARSDVGRIESDRPFRGIDDPVGADNALPDTNTVPQAPEWGVTNVNAPQVWALGFTGQGMVVGNQDTGMRWTHNAIKPKYRGWDGTTADHNYNWWDGVRTPVPGHTTNPCGYAIVVPCDDHSHGSHTTGTTVGGEGANEVGVAPGAKWIGCRNMDAGDGRPTTYISCFQFFVAPHDLAGGNPNPALRPHSMNNSWGCPTTEECAPDTLRAAVEACDAAGIFVVVSAGNAGSGCSSVNDPPAIYEASFSIGATDSSNGLAAFSSRGPVTVDGSNRMKPNISAPGVSVRSCTNGSDTSYSAFSGTSMAGPHVAGVVALLWSARPELVRQNALTKNILQMSANPQVNVNPVQTCGGIPSSQIPNNSFGYGRVDVLAAVNYTGATPTPGGATNTPMPTATRTVAAGTATATPCAGGGWTAGTDYPSPMVRGVGVWFPSNGRFYVVGGRSADTAGTGIRNPHEFNPSTNTWTMMSAQLADDQTSNMAAAVLTGTSGPRIYTVGGSAGGGTVASPRVQVYDPVGNTITELTSDPWPITPTGAVIPGGFAVFNNRMYILGGFEISVGMRNQIWEFDPNRAAGSRWALKTATLPQPLGYIPATVIGNYIYTAGGSAWDGTTIADSQFTYRYDPVADAIDDASIPELPAPGTAETRALTWGGTMWVMGGGRTAPNPSNQVWTWTPGGTSWGTGPAFGTARRNFATEVNPGVAVYIVGGYAINATMEIYRAGGGCATVTRTPVASTNTPIRTNTPVGATNTPVGATSTPVMTSTPEGSVTPCVMTFTDVMQGDYFYDAVFYMFCHGIISGYQDNTFRPYNNTTRAQLSKIIVLAQGWPLLNPPTPTFNDVAVGSTFYQFVETAYAEGIISGYECGTGCLEFRPNNNVTRGQLSKIVVLAMEWPLLDPKIARFTDVARGSTFYTFVETAAFHGIISGYGDNTFRPGNNATRGQISVIIYRAITGPAPTATPFR